MLGKRIRKKKRKGRINYEKTESVRRGGDAESTGSGCEKKRKEELGRVISGALSIFGNGGGRYSWPENGVA